jgi:tRNA acetyltransferase TAN1
LISDFNVLVTTSRGNERRMCAELLYLLKEIGDPLPVVTNTGIRGLIAAKTILSPFDAIEKLRRILVERPYEFRYALRVLPIEKVVCTDLDLVKQAVAELSTKIAEHETFRVTVEKRFTPIHSRDFIEAAATGIQRKADLDNPDKILLIEVVGGLTGLSLVKPSDVLSVVREKMR